MKKKGRLLLVLAIFLALGTHFFIVNNKTGRAHEELIRFHVVANSDSPEDQQLKLRIRDRVLDTLDKEFEKCISVDEARDVIRSRLGEIESIAKDEIARSGKDYSVKAVLGNYTFPTKTYGSTYLPAGEYETFRLVIGRGRGANWWCVMFPPLCFVDISHGVAVEDTTQPLKKAGWSMDDVHPPIRYHDREDRQMEFSFKIVEWWKNVQPRMTRAVSLYNGNK